MRLLRLRSVAVAVPFERTVDVEVVNPHLCLQPSQGVRPCDLIEDYSIRNHVHEESFCFCASLGVVGHTHAAQDQALRIFGVEHTALDDINDASPTSGGLLI